jgi:hypothetical protein
MVTAAELKAAREALQALIRDLDSLPLHAHKRAVVREWIEGHVRAASPAVKGRGAAQRVTDAPAVQRRYGANAIKVAADDIWLSMRSTGRPDHYNFKGYA